MLFGFRANGTPHPQPRPQVTKTGHVYYPDPSGKLMAWKSAVSGAIATQVGVRNIMAPCALSMSFRLDRPKDHFRRNGTLTPKGERNPYPTNARADVDNLAKLILDVLVKRGILTDDGLVVTLNMRKRWATSEFPAGCDVVAFAAGPA